MTQQNKRKDLASGFGKPKNPVKNQMGKAKRGGGGGSSKAQACNTICGLVCASVNPFSSKACGCHTMDGSGSKVFTYSSTSIYSVSTDGNGDGAKYFVPGVQDVVTGASTITGSVVSWTSPESNLPESASLIGSGSMFRIVSAGIRVYSTASADKAAGRVVVATTAPDSNGAPPGGFDLASLLYEEVDTDSIYGYDKSFIFRNHGTGHLVFQDLAENAPKDGWNAFVVGVTGAQTGYNPLSVELTIHMEIQPDPISIYARLASTPTVAPPAITALVHKARGALEMGYTGESAASSIMALVKREVGTLTEGMTAQSVFDLVLALV